MSRLTKKMLWICILSFLVLSACGQTPVVQQNPTPLPYTPDASLGSESMDVAVNTGDATAGKLVFDQHCVVCHSVEDTQVSIGPSLFRAGDRLRFDYVKTSVENPHEFTNYREEDFGAEMPADISQRLTNKELSDVIAYVLSLTK